MTQFLPVEGGRLHYQTAGDPAHPAIVMLHAGIADLRMWQPQVEAFSDRFFCVRYDVRGAGKSESENGKYNNRRDLLALLDHLNIRQAILMGCSRGGQICTDFTLEYPDRVRALVLVGAGLTGLKWAPSTPQEDEVFANMEKAGEAGDWDQVEALELHVWYQGLHRNAEDLDAAYLEKGRAMLRDGRVHALKHGMDGLQFEPLTPPTADRLGEIRVPTLVVYGDQDESAVMHIAKLLGEGIPGAVTVMIPDTAHLPGLEKPAEFNRHLSTFLDRQS